MTETPTDYGRLIVGSKDKLFARAAALVTEAHAKASAARRAPVIAFSGGSTPQDWYRWCVAQGALPAAVAGGAHFTVSDERCVPLTDTMSNFGHADRLLLEPLKVPDAHRHPWPVKLAPAAAATHYRSTMNSLACPEPAHPERVEAAERAGAGRASPELVERGYDVCFLGMGDDGHTASIFPGSPLLRDDGGELFAAVEVLGKGWRLTITPTGLRACGLVVVLALGANKATMLPRVLRGPSDPHTLPIQVLKTCAARVLWLADEAAAAQL